MTNDTQGPEVVAYGAITDYGDYEVSSNPICLGNDKLITLQSHQEAVAKKDAALLAYEAQNSKLKRALVRWREKQWPGTDQSAVVEREYPAITQAQEAMK